MIGLFYGSYALMISGLLGTTWLLGPMVVNGCWFSRHRDVCNARWKSRCLLKNKVVNKLMGLTLNLVGGSAKNWKIQHNRMHHTFTNVHEMDPDISPLPMLRFSPNAKYFSFHKYQHIYAWFFYGLLSFSWATIKRASTARENSRRTGLLKKRNMDG